MNFFFSETSGTCTTFFLFAVQSFYNFYLRLNLGRNFIGKYLRNNLFRYQSVSMSLPVFHVIFVLMSQISYTIRGQISIDFGSYFFSRI